MTTTAFGVDRWFGSWESAQNVGAMLRAMEWHIENARESGWVKVYSASSPGSDADGTRDLLTWDRTVADRLMSGGVSAAALLAAIEANTSLLPASGTSIETLLDETIVCPAAVQTWSSYFDTIEHDALFFWVSNTGANQTDTIGTRIATEINGGGLVGLKNPFAMVVNAGGVTVWDGIRTSSVQAQGASVSRFVARSASLGITSTAGTTVRLIVLGRKPWARD